jgi:hypothetical protein
MFIILCHSSGFGRFVPVGAPFAAIHPSVEQFIVVAVIIVVVVGIRFTILQNINKYDVKQK